jgi:beta-lactamase regulating signal transducer with metallopeptidase domain
MTMHFLQTIPDAAPAAMIVRATLLLLIGWCGALLLRRAPAGARHIMWLTVIVGLLVLPVLARMAPVRVPMLPTASAPPAAAALANDAMVPTNPAAALGAAEPSSRSWSAATNHWALALGVWLGGTMILIGWLLVGMFSVRRVLGGARELDAPEWTGALREAADRLRLVTLPRLVVSNRVGTAFACDALTPAIVLPAEALEWSADRRRAVLLHEMAHVQRRDLFGHLIARIACAVYWFHPLVWIAARHLRTESEHACDDVVLANGMRASDYAQHLLDMVTSLGHGQGAPTGAMPLVRRTEFEGRLLAILDRAQRRSALGRVHLSALIGVLGFSIVSIGTMAPVAAKQSGSAARPTTDGHGTIIAPRPLLGLVVDTPPPTPRRPIATAPRQRYDILIPYVPISADSARILRRVLLGVGRAAPDTTVIKIHRPDSAQKRPR